jgi:hypothetical protein
VTPLAQGGFRFGRITCLTRPSLPQSDGCHLQGRRLALRRGLDLADCDAAQPRHVARRARGALWRLGAQAEATFASDCAATPAPPQKDAAVLDAPPARWT